MAYGFATPRSRGTGDHSPVTTVHRIFSSHLRERLKLERFGRAGDTGGAISDFPPELPTCEPAQRLQRLGRGLRYRFLEYLGPYGITPEQYLILAKLDERDGCGQSELVDPLFDDRANITHLVNQLERGRLVERRADESDGRRRRVWLTATGRSLVAGLLVGVRHLQAELFQDLDDDELATLLRLIERLEARLRTNDG